MRSRSAAIAAGLFLLSILNGMAADANAEILDQNRRIVWQPGVPDGIPLRSAVHYADTGALDSVATINSQLASCSGGQVVQLQAGTYILSSGISLTTNCTLRGAGVDTTTLACSAAWHCVQMGSFPPAPSPISVAGSPQKGATTISVGSVAGLAVGDYVAIDQVNDGTEVVNDATAFGAGECRSGGGTRCLGQIVRITGISGTTLTISPSLHHSYSSAQTPQVWEIGNVTHGSAIEDLAILRTNDDGGSYNNIKLIACSGCWVKSVESRNPDAWHVDLDRVIWSTVRDSNFVAGQSNASGRAYGVVANLFATDNLIENNYFYRNRHSMVLQNGATGNVFGYNYSLECFQGNPAESWLAADMNNHGAHSTMNLFEGNIGCKVYADNAHGSSSYNTVFRNHVTRHSAYPGISQARRAIDIEVYNTNWNILGNVLGQAGQSWTSYDPGVSRSPSTGEYVYTYGFFSDGDSSSDDYTTVRASTFVHGNYDYQSSSTIWDGSNSDHALPLSLYLNGKPAFFGSLPWPSIGPDRSPFAGTIPAKERYDGRTIPPAGAVPMPPESLSAN